ncbi:MAG TPA: hypothetical protein PLD27_11935 [bacterium]|nr:hypothetical protein [bacterium]HOL48870.1 hypothetical protein [bacterium]HPQ19954.1 hypothetical protein [bacterium]
MHNKEKEIDKKICEIKKIYSENIKLVKELIEKEKEIRKRIIKKINQKY